MSDIEVTETEVAMNKRDKFLGQLRDEARQKGLTVRIEKQRGKGGHALIWIGDRVSTIPSRDIDPKTARKIRKALGLD